MNNCTNDTYMDCQYNNFDKKRYGEGDKCQVEGRCVMEGVSGNIASNKEDITLPQLRCGR